MYGTTVELYAVKVNRTVISNNNNDNSNKKKSRWVFTEPLSLRDGAKFNYHFLGL